jgi:GR25 family glycosyltransferase involved in LPS biosynthesis
MEKIDKIFLINLDHRTDRLEHFISQCHENYIPFEKIIRFSAINGKTYNFSEKELSMFKNSEFNTYLLTPHNIVKRLMANQLSHFYILSEMKNRGYENIIILQDDIVFRKNFINYIDQIMADIPNDAEIINLGMHKVADTSRFEPYDLSSEIFDNNIIEKQITNFVCLYKTFNVKPECTERVNPCSLAYIVTKNGCNNLLEHFHKNNFSHATDWSYNLYLQSKNIFYGSKYILATGNNKFKSDVFIETDNSLLEDLIDINLYYTDKNTTHSYFDLYNSLFNKIRNTAKNVLEIGVGNFNEKNGGSIILWKLYFKNATIHCADIISENRVYDIILNDNNIKKYLNVDAYTFSFVEELKKTNIRFDMILDDGPHTFESQCKFLCLYTNLLSDNGILVIEDIQSIEYVEFFKSIVPIHLKKYIHVFDLRNVKNRYDDIVFVIDKNIQNNETHYLQLNNDSYVKF